MQWSEQVIEQIYKLIGERIRTCRAEAKLTQIELGQKVGLTRSSIANIEAGRQRAMIHTIMQIANVLDISPAELFPEPDLARSQHSLFDLNELDGQPKSTHEFVESIMRRAVRS